MATSSKREQLVHAALELFLKRGFQAVGVDAIADAAGVTKKTLYHHFKSKDELILAALRLRDETFRNSFMRAVEAKTEDPEGRLLAVFDAAEEWFRQEDFFGCLFVGGIHEFPDAGTPIHNMCREAKSLVQAYITKLALAAELDQPVLLSEQLALLLEGAIVMAQTNGSPASAAQAKKAAEVLIQNSRTLTGQSADPGS